MSILTRRHFIIGSSLLFSGPLAAQDATTDQEATQAARRPVSDPSNWASWDRRVTPSGYVAETSNPWGFHPRFLPQRVQARDNLTPGDIHVDAVARYLYHIEDGGTAMRYGVAIARGTLYEPGSYTIRRKAKWPTWRPTDDMIKREPEKFEQHADGMDGGPSNPLGSRALYLYVGRRDTYLRIHGTPLPRSIGGRASSGCVRMVMAHIIDLYENVDRGSTAYLYPDETALGAA